MRHALEPAGDATQNKENVRDQQQPEPLGANEGDRDTELGQRTGNDQCERDEKGQDVRRLDETHGAPSLVMLS